MNSAEERLREIDASAFEYGINNTEYCEQLEQDLKEILNENKEQREKLDKIKELLDDLKGERILNSKYVFIMRKVYKIVGDNK